MDPESNAAPIEDTPPVSSAPDEGHAQEPQVDYAKRYNDLRPEFDRTKQQLSEYERQLEAARNGDIEAIRALGFDVDADDDPTPEYDDPYAQKLTEYDKKLQELEQWKQQQEAERIASGIRSHVDSLAEQAGVSLTDADKEYIFGRAVQGDRIGAEATEEAFKAHLDYRNTIINAEKESWIQTKRTPRVGAGQAASKQPDLDNPQARAEYIDAALADLDSV